MKNIEIKDLIEFKKDFNKITNFVIKYNIKYINIYYEPGIGATHNIIKKANELFEKGYKIAILVKNYILVNLLKEKVNKNIFVSCNDENLKGLELDFVFLDDYQKHNENLIYSKHIIGFLRNNRGL